MIIENKRIKIDNSSVIINNGFNGMSVTTSNTPDERAKRESFSSSGSSSGQFSSSSNFQAQTRDDALQAKMEELYNRSCKFEDLLNGSFNDKIVKEKINITNSQVTINNQVNNSSKIAKTTSLVKNAKAFEDVDIAHRQLRSQFSSLAVGNNQVITNLCKHIAENKIGLQFTQIQDIQDRVQITQDLEKKLFQIQALFFKEKEQVKTSIERLLAINKLFTLKLDEYTLVVESNKDFAGIINSTKNEDEILNAEINALQAEIELMTKKDTKKKLEEMQAAPETQVTSEISQPSAIPQTAITSRSAAYNSICYVASCFNPYNYNYFKK